MALKATIYKAAINIADLDRQYFSDVQLTLARHPSETAERMMLRLLAWVMNAGDKLHFTKGLSSEDEPELWEHHDYGSVRLWIELGLPEERRLKKASSLADHVILYAYSERAAQVWWQQNRDKLASIAGLDIWYLDDEQLFRLSAFADRNMTLQFTLQEGVIWLSDGEQHAEFQLTHWQAAK